MVSNESLLNIRLFNERVKEQKLTFIIDECLKESWIDNNLNIFSDQERSQFKECYNRNNQIANSLFIKENNK